MTNKIALITGITGQDGSYLAEFLLNPKISFDELVAEMVREDLKAAERDELIKKHGYAAFNYHE